MQFCNNIVPFGIIGHIEGNIGHLILSQTKDLSGQLYRHNDHVIGHKIGLFWKGLINVYFFKRAFGGFKCEIIFKIMCLKKFPDPLTHQHTLLGKKAFQIHIL